MPNFEFYCGLRHSEPDGMFKILTYFYIAQYFKM